MPHQQQEATFPWSVFEGVIVRCNVPWPDKQGNTLLDLPVGEYVELELVSSFDGYNWFAYVPTHGRHTTITCDIYTRGHKGDFQ